MDEETRKRLESLGFEMENFFVVKQVGFETKNGESGKSPDQ